MKKLLAYLCLFLLVTEYSCKKSTTPPGNSGTIAPPAPFGFYVVGYFPSYRSVSSVSDARFAMCSVVNYAFATIGSSGTLTLASPSVLSAVVEKAHRNGSKVFISLNGDVANWKAMAGTPAGRNNYVKQVMNLVRTYDLQGVDVDWEFPSTSDGSDTLYTALMKEMSDSCHMNARYYLTAAITPGKYAGGYRDAIKAELWTGNYVDFFNIMAYDDFNTTVPYRQHSNYDLAVTCLNYWLNTRGMPASKAVLGLPAYGRASGLPQSGTVLTYKDILAKNGSPLSDSAIVSNGSYTNYTIYYNGQPTIQKKALLAKQRANGVMLWELGQDADDDKSLLKAASEAVK